MIKTATFTEQTFTVSSDGILKSLSLSLVRQPVSTTVSITVAGQTVWTHHLSVAPAPPNSKKKTVKATLDIPVNAGDMVSVVLSGDTALPPLRVDRMPESFKYPAWKVWTVSNPSTLPDWFGPGIHLRLVARANRDAIVEGVVEKWMPVENRFHITDEVLPERWEHNSWVATVIDPQLASVQSLIVVQEYDEPEPVVEEVHIPQKSPAKRRRIMM